MRAAGRADCRSGHAGSIDLRQLEARPAHERTREAGQQRRLALALVGLLRAAPLARRQLGDGSTRQQQRREQQPDARIGRLEPGRRQQHGIEYRDRRDRREHPGAQAEEERHADDRGQVDQAERLVVGAQRAVQHGDDARAERDREHARARRPRARRHLCECGSRRAGRGRAPGGGPRAWTKPTAPESCRKPPDRGREPPLGIDPRRPTQNL